MAEYQFHITKTMSLWRGNLFGKSLIPCLLKKKKEFQSVYKILFSWTVKMGN